MTASYDKPGWEPQPGHRARPRGARTRHGTLSGLVLALAILLSPGRAEGGPRWALEAHLGTAWNLPLPLVIRQRGHPDLAFPARWRTRALERPLYYVARVARWEGDRAWALDLTHHKLYLQNRPPEVGDFAISHGYNLLTVQRLFRENGVRTGAGAGLVAAHPESEIRGLRLDEREGLLGTGYYLSGPTAGALGSVTGAPGGGVYALAEIRLTLSLARVPVAEGSARVPNLALHFTTGIGWESDR